MARMMDSLIMNDFPPYTFTKITTTHRPTRTNNGISTTSKLLTKSTANISTAGTNGNSNGNNANGNASYGLNSGLRQAQLQKAKVPMQGKRENNFLEIKCRMLMWGNLITADSLMKMQKSIFMLS